MNSLRKLTRSNSTPAEKRKSRSRSRSGKRSRRASSLLARDTPDFASSLYRANRSRTLVDLNADQNQLLSELKISCTETWVTKKNFKKTLYHRITCELHDEMRHVWRSSQDLADFDIELRAAHPNTDFPLQLPSSGAKYTLSRDSARTRESRIDRYMKCLVASEVLFPRLVRFLDLDNDAKFQHSKRTQANQVVGLDDILDVDIEAEEVAERERKREKDKKEAKEIETRKAYLSQHKRTSSLTQGLGMLPFATNKQKQHVYKFHEKEGTPVEEGAAEIVRSPLVPHLVTVAFNANARSRGKTHNVPPRRAATENNSQRARNATSIGSSGALRGGGGGGGKSGEPVRVKTDPGSSLGRAANGVGVGVGPRSDASASSSSSDSTSAGRGSLRPLPPNGGEGSVSHSSDGDRKSSSKADTSDAKVPASDSKASRSASGSLSSSAPLQTSPLADAESSRKASRTPTSSSTRRGKSGVFPFGSSRTLKNVKPPSSMASSSGGVDDSDRKPFVRRVLTDGSTASSIPEEGEEDADASDLPSPLLRPRDVQYGAPAHKNLPSFKSIISPKPRAKPRHKHSETWVAPPRLTSVPKHMRVPSLGVMPMRLSPASSNASSVSSCSSGTATIGTLTPLPSPRSTPNNSVATSVDGSGGGGAASATVTQRPGDGSASNEVSPVSAPGAPIYSDKPPALPSGPKPKSVPIKSMLRRRKTRGHSHIHTQQHQHQHQQEHRGVGGAAATRKRSSSQDHSMAAHRSGGSKARRSASRPPPMMSQTVRVRSMPPPTAGAAVDRQRQESVSVLPALPSAPPPLTSYHSAPDGAKPPIPPPRKPPARMGDAISSVGADSSRAKPPPRRPATAPSGPTESDEKHAPPQPQPSQKKRRTIHAKPTRTSTLSARDENDEESNPVLRAMNDFLNLDPAADSDDSDSDECTVVGVDSSGTAAQKHGGAFTTGAGAGGGASLSRANTLRRLKSMTDVVSAAAKNAATTAKSAATATAHATARTTRVAVEKTTAAKTAAKSTVVRTATTLRRRAAEFRVGGTPQQPMEISLPDPEKTQINPFEPETPEKRAHIQHLRSNTHILRTKDISAINDTSDTSSALLQSKSLVIMPSRAPATNTPIAPTLAVNSAPPSPVLRSSGTDPSATKVSTPGRMLSRRPVPPPRRPPQPKVTSNIAVAADQADEKSDSPALDARFDSPSTDQQQAQVPPHAELESHKSAPLLPTATSSSSPADTAPSAPTATTSSAKRSFSRVRPKSMRRWRPARQGWKGSEPPNLRASLRALSRVFTEKTPFFDSGANSGAFGALSETAPAPVLDSAAAGTSLPSESSSPHSAPQATSNDDNRRRSCSRDFDTNSTTSEPTMAIVAGAKPPSSNNVSSSLRSFSASLRSHSSEFFSSVAFKTRKLGSRPSKIVASARMSPNSPSSSKTPIQNPESPIAGPETPVSPTSRKFLDTHANAGTRTVPSSSPTSDTTAALKPSAVTTTEEFAEKKSFAQHLKAASFTSLPFLRHTKALSALPSKLPFRGNKPTSTVSRPQKPFGRHTKARSLVSMDFDRAALASLRESGGDESSTGNGNSGGNSGGALRRASSMTGPLRRGGDRTVGADADNENLFPECDDFAQVDLSKSPEVVALTARIGKLEQAIAEHVAAENFEVCVALRNELYAAQDERLRAVRANADALRRDALAKMKEYAAEHVFEWCIEGRDFVAHLRRQVELLENMSDEQHTQQQQHSQHSDPDAAQANAAAAA